MIAPSIFPYEQMDKLPKLFCDATDDRNSKRVMNSNYGSFKKKRKIEEHSNFGSHNESICENNREDKSCESNFGILFDELQNSSANTPLLFIDKQSEEENVGQSEALHSIPQAVADYGAAKMTSTSGSKKKSRRKAKGRPKGRKTSSHPYFTRPKRPRSAYNFFFQEERNNVLRAAGVIDNSTPSIVGTTPDPEYFQISVKDSYDETNIRKRGRPRGKNYRPRKKQEDLGLFKFNNLATSVGVKWKSLDSEAKKPFEELARLELVHYQDAIKRYNEEIKKFESCPDSGSDQEISSDRLPSSAGIKPQRFESFPSSPKVTSIIESLDIKVGRESEDVLPPLDVRMLDVKISNLPTANYLIDFARAAFLEEKCTFGND